MNKNIYDNYGFVGRYVIRVVEEGNNPEYFLSIGQIDKEDIKNKYYGNINPTGDCSLILRKEYKTEENENIRFSYYQRDFNLESQIYELLATHEVLSDRKTLSREDASIKKEIEQNLFNLNESNREIFSSKVEDVLIRVSTYVDKKEILKKFNEGNEMKEHFVSKTQRPNSTLEK